MREGRAGGTITRQRRTARSTAPARPILDGGRLYQRFQEAAGEHCEPKEGQQAGGHDARPEADRLTAPVYAAVRPALVETSLAQALHQHREAEKHEESTGRNKSPSSHRAQLSSIGIADRGYLIRISMVI